MEGLHGSGDQRQGHRELPHRRGSAVQQPVQHRSEEQAGQEGGRREGRGRRKPREGRELGSKRRGQDLRGSHPDTERLQGGLHRGVLRHGSGRHGDQPKRARRQGGHRRIEGTEAVNETADKKEAPVQGASFLLCKERATNATPRDRPSAPCRPACRRACRTV